MDESNEFTASLKRNRTIILIILMLPVIGMTISIPLIVWRAPSNMVIVLAVIVVLMAQYILLVRWIAKRMDKLTAK